MKILLNIATHGDETIGYKVVEQIKKIKVKQGHNIIVNIANPKAFKIKKRFIDQDLNRSFPGDINGNYEQKIAAKLLPKIREVDLVLDIHSTTSDLKDALIVTKLDIKTKEYVRVIKPKFLLHMKVTKDNALISNAKVGIGFEYGNDKDKKVLKKTVEDIKKILAYLEIINYKNKNSNKNNTKYFEINKMVPKPNGYILLKNIKNYKIIKKGEIFAKNKEKCIRAKKDFYPILFGEKNYLNYFGFEGKLKKF